VGILILLFLDFHCFLGSKVLVSHWATGGQ
jgi:hypothetical protein